MSWLNLTMPNQTVKNCLKAWKIKLPQIIFFLTKTTNKKIQVPISPFHSAKFKKILWADPELWGCAIFRPKMVHFSGAKFFWYNPLLLLSSTYWSFALCKILKNSYSGSRVMTMHHFWAQNGPFAPNKLFFKKIINIILIYQLAPFILNF